MSADRRKEKLQPARPLMPRLAASASVLRTSPAPRLAARSPAATTTSPQNTPQNTPSLIQDVKSTPLRQFVASNITPRSSDRKSRGLSTGSPGFVQNGTPTAARPQSMYASKQTSATSNSRSGSKTRKRSVSTDFTQQTIDEISSSKPTISSPVIVPVASIRTDSFESISPVHNNVSTFFHANDPKPQPPASRPPLHKKTSSFVYANGDRDSLTRDEPKPQIYNLVERSTSRPGRLASAARRSSNVSTASLASPSLSQAPFSPQSPSAFFRAQSPIKDFRKDFPIDGGKLFHLSGASQSTPTLDNRHRRDKSLDSTVSQRNSKTFAFPSVDWDATSQLSRTNAIIPNILTSPASLSAASTNTSPRLMSIDTNIYEKFQSLDDSVEQLHSPISGPGSSDGIPHTQDLAANARRERKVLDLEISNSSLLAINRSLEKEVRKQKLELRRFRRLSRNTNRTSLLSEDLPTTTRLSTLSEDIENTSGEDDIYSNDASDPGSGDEDAMSPSALAESDARHQENDQKRLRIELSKHKDLLVDSQKMNQSLKLCLQITEQLISDGNKALQYQVRVGDVQLGGRVLSPEEQDESRENSMLEIQDSTFDNWNPEGLGSSKAGSSVEVDTTDKDSGVDVDFQKKSASGSPPAISKQLSISR